MINSMILEFNVDRQIIKRLDNFRPVADSKNYLYAHFKFTSDWEGLDKYAVFALDTREIHSIKIDAKSNICLVPSEVIKASGFKVSVKGYLNNDEKLITGNVLNVLITDSGLWQDTELPVKYVNSNTLDIIKEGDVITANIPNIYGTKLSVEAKTGVIKLLARDEGGKEVVLSTIDLPTEKIITNITYDSKTSELVFEFENAAPIRVPIGDIFKLENYYTKQDVNNFLKDKLDKNGFETVQITSEGEETAIGRLQYKDINGRLYQVVEVNGLMVAIGDANSFLVLHSSELRPSYTGYNESTQFNDEIALVKMDIEPLKKALNTKVDLDTYSEFSSNTKIDLFTIKGDVKDLQTNKLDKTTYETDKGNLDTRLNGIDTSIADEKSARESADTNLENKKLDKVIYESNKTTTDNAIKELGTNKADTSYVNEKFDSITKEVEIEVTSSNEYEVTGQTEETKNLAVVSGTANVVSIEGKTISSVNKFNPNIKPSELQVTPEGVKRWGYEIPVIKGTWYIKLNNTTGAIFYIKTFENGIYGNAEQLFGEDLQKTEINSNGGSIIIYSSLKTNWNSVSNIIVSDKDIPYQPYYSGLRNTMVDSLKSGNENLFDEQWELGSIDPNGLNIPNVRRIRSINYLKVIGGKPFSINSIDNDYLFYFMEYDINKNVLKSGSWGNETITLEETAFVRIVGKKKDENIIDIINVPKTMLNYGSQPLPYVPHQEHTLNTMMRKYFPNGMNGNSEVRDRLTPNGAEQYWSDNLVLNGSEPNWVINGPRFAMPISVLAIKSVTTINSKSTWIDVTANNTYSKIEGVCVQDKQVYIYKEDLTTVEQLKTWLQANPITLTYQLATPIITKFDKPLDWYYPIWKNGTERQVLANENYPTAIIHKEYPISLQSQLKFNNEVDRKQQNEIDELQIKSEQIETNKNDIANIKVEQVTQNNDLKLVSQRVDLLYGKTTNLVKKAEFTHSMSVPSNVLGLGMINKIGGQSYKSKNLIPVDLLDNSKWIDEGGQNYYRDLKLPLGTYTIRGKIKSKDDTYYMYIQESNDNWETKKEYRFIIAQTTNIITFQVKQDYKYRWYAFANRTFDNVEQIMLNEGSEPLPYEEPFSGLRDTKVDEVVSEGVNLWDGQWRNGYYTEINTFISNDRFIANVNIIKVVPNKYLSIIPNGKIGRILTYDKDKNFLEIIQTNKPILLNSNVEYINFFMSSSYGGTYNNDIIVCYGTQPLPYTPYIEPFHFPIKKEIQQLEGYGLGLDKDVNNYIDYNKRTFEVMCKKIILNGSEENIRYEKTNNRYEIVNKAVEYSNLGKNKFINDKLPFYNFTISMERSIGIYTGQATIYIGLNENDELANNSGAFRQWLKDNPITLVYALETPQSIDISQQLIGFNDMINVEPNGSITFQNEFDKEVPVEVEFEEVIKL